MGMCPETTRVLHIAPVAGSAQEARALAQMRTARQLPVPVLDQEELVETVRAVFEGYGIAVLTERGDGPSTHMAVRQPGLLVASPGVEPALIALAEALTGREVLQVPFGAELLEEAMRGQHSSALFILNPNKCHADVMINTVAQFAAAGLIWGVCLATDPTLARLSLLKALLLDEIGSNGALEFVGSGGTSHYPVSERLTRDTDVTVIKGHANGFDVSLSPTDILCARESLGDYRAGPGRFPCYTDARCFRQHEGKAPAELHAPHKIGARILMISGCGVAPFGSQRMDFASGLVHGAARARNAAILATCVETIGRPDVDLLGVGRIAEGVALGAVVRQINQMRTEVHGDATGLPVGVGPMILFGNPRLRLTNFPLATCVAEPVEAAPAVRCFRVTVPETPGRTPRLLRATLPHVSGGAYLSLRGSASNSIRTVALDMSATDTAVLCVLEADQQPDILEFETSVFDPWSPMAACAGQAWQHIPLWQMFLDEAKSSPNASDLFNSEIASVQEQLPTLSRQLSQIGMILRNAPSTIIMEAQMELATQHLFDELTLWSRRLLKQLIVIRCAGPLVSYGNTPFLLPTPVPPQAERCFCDTAELGTKGFSSPDGGILRYMSQCGACGASIDDQPEPVLRVTGLPVYAACGAKLICQAQAQAHAAACAVIHAVLVLETWADGQQLTSRRFEKLLPPGSAEAFSLQVTVPSDLTPGIYPVSLIGLVNGALHLTRRMIHIS